MNSFVPIINIFSTKWEECPNQPQGRHYKSNSKHDPSSRTSAGYVYLRGEREFGGCLVIEAVSKIDRVPCLVCEECRVPHPIRTYWKRQSFFHITSLHGPPKIFHKIQMHTHRYFLKNNLAIGQLLRHQGR